jgi:hypothetical protein
MANAGFEVASQDELYELVMTYYQPFAVNVDDPTSTRTPSGPEWDAAIAQERAAALADRTCRADAHGLAMTAIAGRIDNFRQDHAAELADADAFWADLRARALATSS